MSQISKMIADAIADAKIAEGAVFHEGGRDRVLANFNGKSYYILVLDDRDMENCYDGMQIAYEENDNLDKLVDKFQS